MVNDAKESLDARWNEVEMLIDFLGRIEEKKELYSFLSVVSVLKASVFVVLYNMIESTLYLLFEELFDSITAHELKYLDMTVSLQNQYEKYRKESNCFAENPVITLEFKEYSKSVKLFSGNLDARIIREILKKWGICEDFHVPGEEKLLVIKNHRNTLAHGDLSFKEVGRNYTISDLKKMSSYSNMYLIKLIEQFYAYIENEKFIGNK